MERDPWIEQFNRSWYVPGAFVFWYAGVIAVRKLKACFAVWRRQDEKRLAGKGLPLLRSEPQELLALPAPRLLLEAKSEH